MKLKDSLVATQLNIGTISLTVFFQLFLKIGKMKLKYSLVEAGPNIESIEMTASVKFVK